MAMEEISVRQNISLKINERELYRGVDNFKIYGIKYIPKDVEIKMLTSKEIEMQLDNLLILIQLMGYSLRVNYNEEYGHFTIDVERDEGRWDWIQLIYRSGELKEMCYDAWDGSYEVFIGDCICDGLEQVISKL